MNQVNAQTSHVDQIKTGRQMSTKGIVPRGTHHHMGNAPCARPLRQCGRLRSLRDLDICREHAAEMRALGLSFSLGRTEKKLKVKGYQA